MPAAPTQLGAALTWGSLAILWGLAGWLALHWVQLQLAILVGASVLSLGIASLGALLARVQRQAAADRQALNQARLCLEEARRAKSDFFANASHELRTPLNAVIGYADLLATGIGGALTERQAGYVATIGRSGRHLLDIVSDLLNLATLEAGGVELDETTAQPSRLADDCARLVAERVAANGLDLTVACPADLPAIRVDAPRVTQVLLNLLSNATKFTEPGGHIALTGRRTPTGGVAFEVSDTGRGMSAGEIERALEPFGQRDSALARHHAGAGLGLPLARRLTELHGGTLRIDSAKGRGTTVTLALPPARSLAPAARL
ncbi:MAG: HAMP domain-containing histidine kinase [Alphaproteobacteria bacterium]|nr:HAMP domain-containing histidine kinase [Alphaproteobacteria bacterium]